MKLLAYNINNIPVTYYNTWENIIDGNDALKISNINISGYTEISTSDNWAKFYDFVGVDYSFARTEIKNYTWYIIMSIGWTGLTLEQQQAASRFYVIPKNYRDLVHTEQEQIYYWGELVQLTNTSRERRWEAARRYFAYVLVTADSYDLAQTTDGLTKLYKQYAVMSYAEDGIPGLFDYFESTSTYVNTGFHTKPYYTVVIKNEVMKIFRDGIYELIFY